MLGVGVQPVESLADMGLGGGFQLGGKGGAAWGEVEQNRAAVAARALALDEFAVLEPGKDAAEIACILPQCFHDGAGR